MILLTVLIKVGLQLSLFAGSGQYFSFNRDYGNTTIWWGEATSLPSSIAWHRTIDYFIFLNILRISVTASAVLFFAIVSIFFVMVLILFEKGFAAEGGGMFIRVQNLFATLYPFPKDLIEFTSKLFVCFLNVCTSFLHPQFWQKNRNSDAQHSYVSYSPWVLKWNMRNQRISVMRIHFQEFPYPQTCILWYIHHLLLRVHRGPSCGISIVIDTNESFLPETVETWWLSPLWLLLELEAHPSSLTSLPVVFARASTNWFPENALFLHLNVRCLGITQCISNSNLNSRDENMKRCYNREQNDLRQLSQMELIWYA